MYAMFNLCTTVCIQTKHQDTIQIFHHNLVILGMISCANIYLCTHWNYNLNLLYVCNGQSVCIQTKHQDTNQIFHHNLVILRMIICANIYLCTRWKQFKSTVCNDQSVCIQTKHQDTIQIFSSQFSYLRNDKLCKHILMHSLKL